MSNEHLGIGVGGGTNRLSFRGIGEMDEIIVVLVFTNVVLGRMLHRWDLGE